MKSQTRLSDFTFTFHFHALEKEMATHSSVLAWRIPGTGEPGGLLLMGSHSRTRLKLLSSSSMLYARRQGGLRVLRFSKMTGPLYLPDGVRQWSPREGLETLWGLHIQGSATDRTQSHRHREEEDERLQSLTGFVAADE